MECIYRHSNNKHFGSIEDIISFTEYTINGVDFSIPLNGFYEDNNNSHHPTNVKKQLFLINPFPLITIFSIHYWSHLMMP
jgi:hypothetical protein